MLKGLKDDFLSDSEEALCCVPTGAIHFPCIGQLLH